MSITMVLCPNCKHVIKHNSLIFDHNESYKGHAIGVYRCPHCNAEMSELTAKQVEVDLDEKQKTQFVIMMNDSPVGVAPSEAKAQDACRYIGKLFGAVQAGNSLSFEGKYFVHYREVPGMLHVEDFHKVFLQNGGANYQHVLNVFSFSTQLIDRGVNAPEPWVQEFKGKYAGAIKLFQEFRKTYPAIDEFIERTKNHSEGDEK